MSTREDGQPKHLIEEGGARVQAASIAEEAHVGCIQELLHPVLGYGFRFNRALGSPTAQETDSSTGRLSSAAPATNSLKRSDVFRRHSSSNPAADSVKFLFQFFNAPEQQEHKYFVPRQGPATATPPAAEAIHVRCSRLFIVSVQSCNDLRVVDAHVVRRRSSRRIRHHVRSRHFVSDCLLQGQIHVNDFESSREMVVGCRRELSTSFLEPVAGCVPESHWR